MIVECSQTLLMQIRKHVESEAPLEACGLLVGKKKKSGEGCVTQVYAAQNLAKSSDEFELDPSLRLFIQRHLREHSSEDSIIGHYHSHPNASALPSKVDESKADEKGLFWLIVGLANGYMDEYMCYVATNKGLEPVVFQVTYEKNGLI